MLPPIRMAIATMILGWQYCRHCYFRSTKTGTYPREDDDPILPARSSDKKKPGKKSQAQEYGANGGKGDNDGCGLYRTGLHGWPSRRDSWVYPYDQEQMIYMLCNIWERWTKSINWQVRVRGWRGEKKRNMLVSYCAGSQCPYKGLPAKSHTEEKVWDVT